MRYLSISEILELHERLIDSSGGATGIRDLGALESALSQPHTSFGGQDLYPDLIAKAAALCFSLVMNHPFLDGNKRVGHAAMETFLLLNGCEVSAEVDEQERVILSLAAGQLDRNAFVSWLKKHTTKALHDDSKLAAR
jgi:death on curing protein